MSMDGRLSGIETALSRVIRVERKLIFERIHSRVSSIGSPGDEVHPSVAEVRTLSRKLFLEIGDVNIADLEKAVNELPYDDERGWIKRLILALNTLSGAES